MYAPYWGLREAPFRPQPDERWFFESPAHAEALARLFFVIEEQHPFGLLTGGEGTGKTLVLRLLSQHVVRSRRHLAFLDLDGQDADGFAWKLAGELRLAPRSSDGPAAWWRAIGDTLAGAALARRQTVVLLDHFDSASPGCMAAIERVVALARAARGQMTIIAAARDPRRGEVLSLVQRMSALRIPLPAFDRRETAEYVTRTLELAGRKNTAFEPEALDVLYDSTGGVPRLINQLCELSLLAAMHDESPTVASETVRNAAAELFLPA